MFFREILRCSSQSRMRFSDCNVRTKSGERTADNSGKVVERKSNGSTLQDDSKAVLLNPEGPLSSSMPSCVRGSVTVHVRQWACSRVASRSHALSVCARRENWL